MVTPLAEFGSDDSVATGSTIGPDGGAFVTDGVAGAVLRIDGGTGDVSPYADGLPRKAFPDADIGGPVDVGFAGDTAYGGSSPWRGRRSSTVSRLAIRRRRTASTAGVEPDGSNTLVAELGQWSVDHPPEPEMSSTPVWTFALETHPNELLVTDGHHNRVLRVSENGLIDEVATFENVVPTSRTEAETVAGDILVTRWARSRTLPRTAKSSP